MRWTRVFGLLWGAGAACALLADSGSGKDKLDEWMAAGNRQTAFKWSAHSLPIVLSNHQRLLARFEIQIDRAEAAKRRGEGQLNFFFRLIDSQGRVFQDRSEYDLEKVEQGIKASDLVCADSAFVMPGDYQVVFAVLDTATGEHAFRKDKLHVAPLRVEPLPDAWRELPAVEFVPAKEKPEKWFLPEIFGKLNLPVTPRHPVRVDVLVNLTPAEQVKRAYGMQDLNLALLFPALKVISQMSGETSLNVSLLDLARRRVVFHQEKVETLDWAGIGDSIAEPTSGSIDVGSLAKRARIAAFFGEQVQKSIEKGGACAVIVLSAPMNFDAAQDLEGLELKPSPDCKVFYVRRQALVESPVMDPAIGGRRRGGFPVTSPRGRLPQPEFSQRQIADQLENVVKPLDPKLFDVYTPEEFRRVMAGILAGISSL